MTASTASPPQPVVDAALASPLEQKHGVQAYAMFAFAWAVAGLVHNGSTGDLFRVSVDVLFTIAAWAVVLKPGSMPRIAIMLVALGPSLWLHAPHITNHWIIYAFGSIWLGAGLLILGVRRGALPTGEEWYTYCAPALRIATFIVYFWVVFHKLNVTFFDPELSCAVEMYGWLAAKFGLPAASWTAPFAIWGTLLAEAGIPLLLAFRRTRMLGIAAGIAFHSMLGINGFFNFTAVVTALYALFLDESFGRGLVALREIPWIDRVATRIVSVARQPATFWVGAVLALLAMFIPRVFGWDDVQARVICRYSTEVVWLLYTGVVAAILALVWWHAREPIECRVSFGVRGLAWLVVVLFIVNGTSPYLGFKTENSFSMFSNLRTEGPYWNHSLMPRSIRVLPYQDQLVEIVSTDDPGLQGNLDRGRLMVFHMFHRHVAARPDLAVTYRRGGEVIVVPRVGDDPLLSEPPRANRWLWFRPVDPVDRTSCSH